MNDTDKTKEQLIRELQELRQRNAALESRLSRQTNPTWDDIPLVDEHEASSDSAANFTGITGYKQVKKTLEEQRDFLRILLDTLPNPVFYKDCEGRYTGCNRAFEEFVGKSSEEIIGKTVYDMGPPAVADVYAQKDQELFQTPGTQRYEWKVQRHNGEIRDVIFHKAPLRDQHGNVNGLVGVISDITERKTIEHQLREANAAKDKFFSIIAHDIKNPFLAILTGTEILQERLQNTDDDLTLTIIRELYTTTQRVYKLLENLLTWARMQQGTIPYNPDSFNLCDSIQLCLQLLHDQAAHKQITLTCLVEQETLVYADIPMLDAILRNLISNAIKFTPKGGAVMIKAREHDDLVEITIMDTGVGMHADKLQKLFIPGEEYASSRDTEGEQGTGLGLILCKEFVERHGGQIWVASEVGKGSTFTVTLPKGKVT